jgi:DNA repair protein RecO (recombination protein O)
MRDKRFWWKMANYTVTGIVLDSDLKGERDVEMEVFTLERGRMRMTVRGVKKLESTLRGAVEPLTEGLFFLAERRGSDILTEWEAINCHFELKKKAESLAAAGFLARYVTQIQPAGSPDNKLYIFIKNILNLLHFSIQHDIIMTVIKWGILMASGQAPEMDVCAECGSGIKNDGEGWSVEAGGVVCGNCVGGRRMRRGAMGFGRGARMAAKGLMEIEIESVEEAAAHAAALSTLEEAGQRAAEEFSTALGRFCDYHLFEGISKLEMRAR